MAEIIQKDGTWTFDGDALRLTPGRDRNTGLLRGELGEVVVPLGPAVTFPSFARRAGRAASGACSRRAGPRPSYWMYLGLGPVRRECVHGVARQAGM